MDELRAVKARLQAALDDSGLYGRDPDRFAKLSAALAETEAKLSEAEEEWLNLELLAGGNRRLAARARVDSGRRGTQNDVKAFPQAIWG